MDTLERRSYAVRLGERLRNVRQQQGLSLHDVEVASGGSLKASVVGAYERGERAVSVARLRTLADFYKVPIHQLLPERDIPAAGAEEEGGMRIDLTQLERADIDDVVFVSRYLEAIKAQRGDYNGRVLTVRRSDVNALAAVLDVSPSELRERLERAGIAQ